MQIYEITSRKKLDEGIGTALAGGLAKAVANKFVSSTLGIDPRGGGPDDPLSRSAAAMEINKGLAAQLGQKLHAVWENVLKNFIAAPGRKGRDGMDLNDIRNATDADLNQLKTELNKLVVDTLKLDKPLDAWAASIKTDDPADANLAQKYTNQIKATIENIWKFTRDGGLPQEKTAAFAQLGLDIAQLQNVNQMLGPQKQPGTNPDAEAIKYDERTGQWTFKGQPYDATKPDHKAAMTDYQSRRR